MTVYPLKFHPLFKEKVWGGRNMARVFGERLPPGQSIGESWEVSGYGDEVSIVANGVYRGTGASSYGGDLRRGAYRDQRRP